MIPRRPGGEDKLDTINDEMWGLMGRCWDYAPHKRPNCEDIHRCVVDLAGVQRSEDLQKPTSAKAVRSHSGVAVNYERVHDILFSVSRAHDCFERFIPDELLRDPTWDTRTG